MTRQIPLPLGFDPQQGFDEYHPGINAEAVSHLRQFATDITNPFIYLWGGRSLGKSHLINACCREAHRADLNSAYLPLATLCGKGCEILEGLWQLDLVGIDDIDTIAGDEDWELALFDLFNRIRDHGHRLIVSAQQPPSQLPLKLPDLKTRLEWGLTLMLRPLDDDDKLRALGLQAKTLGLELSEPVGRFLLNHYHRDFGTLRQLLEKLDHATLAARRKLTVPFLKSYLEQRL